MGLDAVGQSLDRSLPHFLVVDLPRGAQPGPSQQGSTSPWRLEYSVQVRPQNPAIRGQSAIGAVALQYRHRAFQTTPPAHAGMNFITPHLSVLQRQNTRRIAQ